MAQSILLFGATGPSGMRTLEQALERGHKVTAIARSPEKLSDYKHENLTVVTGDAYDKSTFIEAMRGKDAVVSCLGGKIVLFGTADLYSSTIKQIHEAMVECGVQRGIFMSSWGSKIVSSIPWYYKLQLYFVSKNLVDLSSMEEYLQSSGQDIKYTVVRVGRLNNGPQTKVPFVVKEDAYFLNDIPVDIARSDVARFLLDCLDTSEHDSKIVAIGINQDKEQS